MNTTQTRPSGTRRQNRKFDDAFRIAAVDRVLKGEVANSVARSLGIQASQLSNWVKKYRGGNGATKTRKPRSIKAAKGTTVPHFETWSQQAQATIDTQGGVVDDLRLVQERLKHQIEIKNMLLGIIDRITAK